MIVCSECKKEVFTFTEREDRLCFRCADRLIERANERREWEHYHPRID